MKKHRKIYINALITATKGVILLAIRKFMVKQFIGQSMPTLIGKL